MHMHYPKVDCVKTGIPRQMKLAIKKKKKKASEHSS